MRIAVVSDIHGNLPALDAVLDDIAASGADVTVNLGDIVSGPLWPAETAERLMALTLPTIRGNHERQLLALPRERPGASDAFAAARLRPEQREWLAALPTTIELGRDVFCCHGTPTSDLQYFLETVTAPGYAGPGAPGLRAATRAEAAQRAGGVRHDLILCGHTHVPRALRLEDGRLVVNPGSVGLQAYDDMHPWPHVVENGTPHARYALLTRRVSGWQIELRALPYDWESAARRAQANGRRDWADALRSGCVGRWERAATRTICAMNAILGWTLAAVGLGVGWRFYGWQGVLLAATATIFWLLLQFSRAMRAMKNAGQAPVGHVPSAVMLNAKLKPGMTMLQVIGLTKSLGRRLGALDDAWAWQDDGGSVVNLRFARGKLAGFELVRPPVPDTGPPAPAP